MNEVHSSDRQRRQFRPCKEQGGDVLANQRTGVSEVDADDGSTVGKAVPRQQVAGVAEHDGQGHEGHTDEPVELTWVAVGTGEVDATHVKKHAGDHEVGCPVVNGTQDVAEGQLRHDVLHAGVSRRRIAFATGDVVDAEHGSRDHENDERKEGDATKAVERVPVPDDTEFVLLSVGERHLSVHVVVSALRHVPVVLETEPGVEP